MSPDIELKSLPSFRGGFNLPKYVKKSNVPRSAKNGGVPDTLNMPDWKLKCVLRESEKSPQATLSNPISLN